MANPRVHEVAAELGVPTAFVLDTMRLMGEFVKSGSSSIAPPVARKVKAAVSARAGIAVRLPPAAAIALARVPLGLPALIESILAAENGQGRTLSVVRAAAASKFALHVGPTAAAQLATRRETKPALEDIPAPVGVAGVRAGDELILLSWQLDGERLHVSLLSIDGEVARVIERGRADLLGGEFVSVGRDDPVRSLAMLARIPHVIPVRDDSSPPNQRGGTTASPATSRTTDSDVHVVYLSRGSGEQTGLRAAVKRASRWTVRGHHRQQWYPSTGEHRRVWIAEHEAGNAAAPVRPRRIVYALR